MTALRQHSIIGDMGFTMYRLRYFSGINPMVYTTGEAYIQTPKPTSTTRSRYFVVREATMMPKPRPRMPVCKTSTGARSSVGPRAKR